MPRNQNYGGEFSSHSFTSLLTWAANLKEKQSSVETKNVEGETVDENSLKFECNNNMENYYFDVEHKFNEKYAELKKSNRTI